MWNKRADELLAKGIFSPNETDTLKQMVDSSDFETQELGKELIRLRIESKLLVGLNRDQTKAFLSIVDFIKNGGFDAMLVEGYAGTGKTFLMQRVIEFIKTCMPSTTIALTAPTNKAVHVLHKNSPYASKTNIFEDYGQVSESIAYLTTHKLLGFKENITDSGEQLFVSEKGTDSIRHYAVVGVDEVSMLPDKIFRNIMDYKDKAKIIFMGDPLQIPPVGKKIAAIFTSRHGFKIGKCTLKEIMRQKGEHPVVDVAQNLRDNIFVATDPGGVIESIINGDRNGIVVIDKVKHRSRIRPILKVLFKNDEYRKDPDYVKVIAYKNKTVAYINSVVRDILYGKDKAAYEVGERIIAEKPLFARKDNLNIGTTYSIKANSSDEFEVMKCVKVERVLEERSRHHYPIKFKGWFWKLSVYDPKDSSRGILELFVIHQDSEEDYKNLIKKVVEGALSKKLYGGWNLYYSILKWSDKISYSYAITAHKAQGSGYENVFLMEEDIMTNFNVYERNRILYTCYGRTIKKLYLLR